DITLVALFEGYYNVTFKVDQEETIITVKENTPITKPTDPVKEACEFRGWYLDNELYDFNTLVTKDITLVALFDNVKPIIEISVETNKLNIGYSTQIQSIFHNTEELKLSYEVDEEGIVYINSKGLVTALKPGVVRIKAYHEDIYSNEIKIEVLDEILNEDKIDLNGYTITHEFYNLVKGDLKISNSKEDQLLYQYILKLEEEYNFTWEFEYGDYLSRDCSYENFDSNFSIEDELINKNELQEITSLYKKYMNDFPYQLREDMLYFDCYNNRTYFLPYFSFVQTQSLYYSEKKLKELGLEDPFDLYLEGKWTYSDFISWCQKAKDILDATQKEEDKIYSGYYYVLGGEERSLFYGLMTTVNKTTIDTITKEIQFDSDEFLEIKELINNLTKSGIYNSEDTYGYNRLLFTPDAYSLNALNYRRDEEIRMVPYPYPDNYNPEDVKFGQGLGYSVIRVFFPTNKAKNYPEGVEFEEIFKVICEILNYRHILSFSEDYRYEALKNETTCESDRHLSFYSKLPVDDYIFADPLFFDNTIEILDYKLIDKYLYNDNYKESDEYKEFLDLYERLYRVKLE
ncbi:MAG: extracellular solute-binding protein, partial [Bacilli bacterium]|nr:extracellular solute-binding protein [Bacilli bacterium]